jgi:taurine dioxygenase
MADNVLEISVAALGDFGVEVRGVDLSEELDSQTQQHFRELFDAHQLLVFRGQQLDAEDELRFCRYVRPVVDDIMWISNLEKGFHPESALLYHSDWAFSQHPTLGIALSAVELGEGAAPTSFASNIGALQTMPPDLRQRLRGLQLVSAHDTSRGNEDKRTRLEDFGGDEAPLERFPRAVRPAIWTHPVTGDELLYVGELHASHFQDLPFRDSDELLEAVFAHQYQPANVYEHVWQVGDFVVWDNIALQHGRRENPNTVRRSLRRVAMSDVPLWELVEGTAYAS